MFKNFSTLITSIVVIVAVVILTSALLPIATSNPRATLERRGYIVLAAGEYESLLALLQSVDAKADAAVVAAEIAATAAEIAATKVDLFNSAEVYLYPATTNVTCTFTAGNTNTWSAWTEIVDSDANTLSSHFVAAPGYVSDIHTFLPSDANDGYNIEIAYGDAKTILGRTTFWAPADSIIPYILPIKSRRVSVGETIYYRMQSTGANSATVQVRMRYFYE